METIIPIKGNVKFKITLDPGVWIFDDRRIDLKTFFTEQQLEKNELDEYTKNMSAHWSREIMEGATYPPTLKTEKKYEKTKILTGTFGIYLKHFLKNAEVNENAKSVIIETENGEEHTFTLEQADSLIFKYSQDGKPLLEDGPVYVLFADGSNLENPIKHVQAVRVD
ncbi:peptidyl-prolyl cis-trans isomerase [Paenisporosarcina quisquiliarum]|uniref:Peptidyl-prolyl cis-trans isomerase n=1 Tax=Paenisporosarcina quisquiliarum TaxID=365346 RepID=A0A9X3LE93_9BACL|nr:peptidyl-prolyl cis-trans isomerase [Paenisporosarcina quisquiliarum]MCZ8536438.1 peptidyl-prolyl cis-trans isomerase [Paenisporosarcina quisquiliarum]